MESSGILVAAICGALGGAGGALIGVLVGRAFGGMGTIVGVVVTIAGMVLGAQFGPRYLAPVLEPALQDFMSNDIRAELEAELRTVPLMDAYFERFPEDLAPALDRAQAAYDRGGQAALMQETMAIGEELGMNAVTRMGPYSSDAMLRRFFDATVDIGRLSRDDNPRLCYSFYYSGIAPQNIDPNIALELETAPGADVLQETMADLIRQAGDEIYPVDFVTAQAAMQEANSDLNGQGNPADMRYLMGARPGNDEEYTEACDVMLRTFDAYGSHADSAAIIRMMFGSGG
jgi:hypothetical protein